MKGKRADGDLDRVIRVLDRKWVHKHITLAHDEAREEFTMAREIVEDGPQFQAAIIEYVKFHLGYVGGEVVSDEGAFSLGTRILIEGFPKNCQLDGYRSALATAVGRNPGGLPTVINVLAFGFKRDAIRQHIEAVYHEHINPLSIEARARLIDVLISRHGEVLGRFGRSVREFDLISKPLEALQLIRTELETILTPLDSL